MVKESTVRPKVKTYLEEPGFITLDQDQLDLERQREAIELLRRDMEDRQRRYKRQEKTLQYLQWVFSVALAVSIGLFFLQGFHAWGFDLSVDILKILATGTVGEVGGLLAIALNAIYGVQKERKDSRDN